MSAKLCCPDSNRRLLFIYGSTNWLTLTKYLPRVDLVCAVSRAICKGLSCREIEDTYVFCNACKKTHKLGDLAQSHVDKKILSISISNTMAIHNSMHTSSPQPPVTVDIVEHKPVWKPSANPEDTLKRKSKMTTNDWIEVLKARNLV